MSIDKKKEMILNMIMIENKRIKREKEKKIEKNLKRNLLKDQIERIERGKKRRIDQEVVTKREIGIIIIIRNIRIIEEKVQKREVRRDLSLDLEAKTDVKVKIQIKIRRTLI